MAVREIRAKSGLPYVEIARLVGVERRTVYFWLEGRAIAPENLGRLQGLLDVVRRLQSGVEVGPALLNSGCDWRYSSHQARSLCGPPGQGRRTREPAA